MNLTESAQGEPLYKDFHGQNIKALGESKRLLGILTSTTFLP